MFIYLIFIILVLLYATAIQIYRIGWRNIPEKNFDADLENLPKFSIIVAVRNEEQNILSLIHAVLEQDYPTSHFELIVIDDYSTDKTVALAQSINSSCVKIIALSDHIAKGEKIHSYKKKAIETGIKYSSGEVIITTDGDCIPEKKWLLSYADYFSINMAMAVSGPVAIKSEKKNLLTLFQITDVYILQGITGGALQTRLHPMANGANFAYRRSAFEEVNGFGGIDNISSGDDILLMEKFMRHFPDKVFYNKSKNAIIYTAPEPDLRSLIRQRIRWAGKFKSYSNPLTILIQGGVFLFNLLLVFLAILATFNPAYITLLLIGLVMKLFCDLQFAWALLSFFGNKKLIFHYILLQPFHIIYTISLGFMGLATKPKWKDRKIT